MQVAQKQLAARICSMSKINLMEVQQCKGQLAPWKTAEQHLRILSGNIRMKGK